MGLAERKPQEQPEKQEEQSAKAPLLNSSQLFNARSMPYFELEWLGADGTTGPVMYQALSLREWDEINEVQDTPVLDGKGNVIEKANRIGFHAKIIARALRNPDRTPVAGPQWKQKAEEIADKWLAGVVRDHANIIAERSGYGYKSRAEQKKDS